MVGLQTVLLIVSPKLIVQDKIIIIIQCINSTPEDEKFSTYV